MLPTVRDEFDAFDQEVNAFETLGSDASPLEQVVSITSRINALEDGVRDILDITQVRFIVDYIVRC